MMGRFFFVMTLAAIFAPAIVLGADAKEVKVEPMLGGLDNPVSIALRPGTNDVFISESGAGRVVRVVAGSPNKIVPVVTDFPVAPFPGIPSLRVGPLGLAFLDRMTLVCGSGGVKDEDQTVRIFAIPTDDKPKRADEVRQRLGTVRGAAEPHLVEGWLWGVVAVPEAIFATSRGDESAGWVCRAFVISDRSADLKTFIQTKASSKVGAPMGLTISKRGELVVGQAGQFDANRDSQLSFYNPKNGKLLLTLPTGLFDIVGLAYSPQTGLLYAVDLAVADDKQAGLFRLDATQDGSHMGVKAVKIAALDKPTALAFAPDGTLYITLLGAAKTAGEKSGQLVKIAPGL
jgi:DNA-binding beta-propeller fold protein YncE